MAFSFTFDDITKGYNAVSNLDVDSKNDILGQPVKKDLYYTRKVYFLIIEDKARAGDTAAQNLISAIPLTALKNNNATDVVVTYNSEVFTWAPGDIYVSRENEAEFFIEKSTFDGTPLTRTPLAAFFTPGKSCFYYW